MTLSPWQTPAVSARTARGGARSFPIVRGDMLTPPQRFSLFLLARLGKARGKDHGHFTTGGMDDRMLATLPPVLRPNVVPRS